MIRNSQTHILSLEQIIFVCFLMLVASVIFFSSLGKSTQQSSSTYQKKSAALIIPTTPPAFKAWQTYKNVPYKYAVKIPTGWSTVEQNERKNTIFSPQKDSTPSAFTQIVINVVDKGKKNDTYVTQDQFNQLFVAENSVTTKIDGVDAIVLTEKKGSVTKSTTWLRKNDLNYYIVFESNKELNEDDKLLQKYLLYTFTVFSIDVP